MSSAFHDQPDILQPCKNDTSLHVCHFCCVNYIIWKLLEIAGILCIGQTGIILQVRLIDAGRVFCMKVRDSPLRRNVCTRSIIEHGKRGVADSCWR